MLCLALVARAQVGDLPRCTPAEQGVPTQAVIDMVDALLTLPETEIHHLMVLRNGHVIAEAHPAPFAAEDAHTLFSASKTFVSMAVGIAIGENRLRLTDRVATFFPGELPDTISDNLAAMTVRDLLIMGSGITPDWTMRNLCDNWEQTWLAKPVAKPAQDLLYDSMSTFMLSALVPRVTGKTTLEYLQERMFTPMHITTADWEQSPGGVNTGGWGLRLQAESQAKLGLLLLQRGAWNNQQLVPHDWVEQAIAVQTNYANVKPTDAVTDGNAGYGYQIWRCKWPTAFRADGALGQYIVVDDNSDVVVVINGASMRGHDELACIWNHLLPALSDAPLPAEPAAQARLEKLCAGAALPKAFSGKKAGRLPSQLRLDGKNSLGIATVDFEADVMRLTYGDGRAEALPLDFKQWTQAPLQQFPPYSIGARNRFGALNHNFRTAGHAAWTSRSTLVVQQQYVNWYSATTFTFDFKKGLLTLVNNYAMRNVEQVPFTVTAQ